MTGPYDRDEHLNCTSIIVVHMEGVVLSKKSREMSIYLLLFSIVDFLNIFIWAKFVEFQILECGKSHTEPFT